MSLGDVTIDTGDVVLGDADGVVVIARDRLAEIARNLEEVATKEAALHAQIENGSFESLLSKTVRQAIRYVD